MSLEPAKFGYWHGSIAKELTVRELARIGRFARARARAKAEIRSWGKLGAQGH